METAAPCSWVVGVIAGAVLLPFCVSPWTVMLTLGVLLPGSLGLVSYGLLVSIVSAHVSDQVHSLTSGTVNASSGIGSTLLAPIISTTIAAGGLANGMMALTVLATAVIPVTLWMCRDTQTVSAGKQGHGKIS